METATRSLGVLDATEVEWQFDALDLRPVERWLAALPARSPAHGAPVFTVLAKPALRLVDTYMDTADWRIGRAGFVLRTRHRASAVEATLKDTRPASAAGLRQRLELTESLPSGLDSLGAAGPVGRRVRAVAGSRALVQVLEVRTRRQPFSLRADGVEVAELALDDTTILVGAGQPPAHLQRVEVEVVPAWADALAPLVDDLRQRAGLSPAALSKFEAGMLAAGLQLPGPPELGPTDVGPGATLGDLAYAVLRRQLQVLVANEPGTRLGEDPEALHDMRVSTRRLRAACAIFADALAPDVDALREELRWLASVLGAVRDLDVQLERMAEMAAWSSEWAGADHGAALAHLGTLLDAERDEARRHLLDALDSARYENLVSSLVSLAQRGPGPDAHGADVPAALAVPPLILERHRVITKAARAARRSGAPEDFHSVRIRGKRLRYSIEFSTALYGAPAQKMAKKLTALQDLLGTIQDAEVAAERLFALATGAQAPSAAVVSLPASTVFVMGGIAERYRQESRTLRAEAPAALRALGAKAWKRFEDAMADARAEAVASAQASPAPETQGSGTAPGRETGGGDWVPRATSEPPEPAGEWAGPTIDMTNGHDAGGTDR